MVTLTTLHTLDACGTSGVENDESVDEAVGLS